MVNLQQLQNAAQIVEIRIRICIGRMKMTNEKNVASDVNGAIKNKWIYDECYQTVLRAAKTIVFEYDPVTGKETVVPYIHEFLAGNYDDRLLSEVMLADDVIYPEDLKTSIAFKKRTLEGIPGEMKLRLKNPEGEYEWYKMSLLECAHKGRVTYIGVLTNINEEARQRELLSYRAEYDSVTGIYNKNKYYEMVERQLREGTGTRQFLLLFDIDRFKIINETYSVSEGDKVLAFIGKTLKRLARPGETYARMENDVFSICLKRSEEEAISFIEKLEHEINSYPLDFQFIFSTGILRISEYKGETISLLCDRASMAQRKVKGNYVQRYAFFEENMKKALKWEHYITGCMRQALEKEQFEVYLQPKYDIRNKEIVGAEALVRWKHPVDGMISPGQFIPLFEQNGFILNLDEYIWERSCRMLRKWLDKGIKPVPISVNVSRIHIYDSGFCDTICRLVDKYRLPPELLELEITESAYTESPQVLYDIMDRLQEKGFIFLMDDFGSGYSSLNVLKDIPVDVVKIDLNFLKKARKGEGIGRDILRGTVQLINSIELPIVVEGVETCEQADFLLSVGCFCAQGYYYARPMAVEAFEALAGYV